MGQAAYSVAGPASAPVIIFVHGAALTRVMWQPQLEALAARYRVAALDLPGHGALADVPFTLEGAVNTLGDVIDALDATGHGHAVLLVGLSLGGYVALSLAAREAMREAARVAGIVLSGCAIDYRLLGWPSALDAWASLRLVGEKRVLAMQERTIREMVAPALAEEVLAAGFTFGALPRVYRELARHDFRGLAARYPGPALVLTGEHDRPNQRALPRLLAALRDGSAETIAGAGHACNLERPEAFTTAVDAFAARVFGGE